jgi:transcriptional regulator with XRE-family HTH domain
MAIVENKTVFAKNLKHYIELNGVLKIEVARAVKVSSGTISDWLSERSYPRMDKIQLLAEFFEIKKTDLIEEHTPDFQFSISRTALNLYNELINDPDAVGLYQDIKKLSPENRDIVKALIKNLGGK